MIDKITAKIKKYPFQTGIILGCLGLLIIIGFISLFQDNGRSLSGNADIIREDYLRMTINEYGQNRDDQLAGWRYKHLGAKADSTLELMESDESVSPQLLAAFAQAVGKKDMLLSKAYDQTAGTPSSPRKGLSGFGKTILVILGIVVLCAAGFYAASIVKTRQKQKRRSDQLQNLADEPVNVITPEKARMTDVDVPDTLFDLDDLFPKKSAVEDLINDDPVETKPLQDIENRVVETESMDLPLADEAEAEVTEISAETETEEAAADEITPENDEISAAEDGAETTDEDVDPVIIDEAGDVADEVNETEEAPVRSDAETEPKSVLEYETSIHDIRDDIEESQPTFDEVLQNDVEDNTDKPLLEIEGQTDPENEDALLKMIRSGKPSSDVVVEDASTAEEPENPVEDANDAEQESLPQVQPEEAEASEDDILIHYQSTYRIGNDMYDEVFSIDQGETFRGECGIGIGETLNNTEPKAVTAFELWLFDKDDIHTATWYLMSDFALSNEGISGRLAQHGNCERIRNNGVYVLETETLQVEIRVLELEYGTEMEEKNSYFTNVTFDVIARSRQSNAE